MTRPTLLLLVVALATTCITAELYDVTTIYRMEESQPANKVPLPSVQVLSLTKITDILWRLVAAPSTASRGLLCLQMKTSIATGGAISVSVVDEEQPLLLGYLNASDNKALTWKFFSEVDFDDSKTLLLKVIQKGKTGAFGYMKWFRSCLDEDADFINVAINRACDVEIHGRTNAVGLPFALRDDTTVGATVGVDLPECSGGQGRCDGTISNWTRGDSNNFSPQPFLQLEPRNFTYTIVPDQRSESSMFDGSFEFQSRTPNFKLFLTDSSDNIETGSSYFFYLKAGNQNHYSYPSYYVYFYKCIPRSGHGIPGHPGINPMGCQNIQNPSNQVPRVGNVILHGESVRVVVSITGGRILLRVKTPEPGSQLRNYIDWTDSSAPIQVKYFSFSSESVEWPGNITRVGAQPVLSLSDTSGSLTSPWILSHDDQICVSLVYFMEASSSIQLAVQKIDGDSEVVAQLKPTESQLGAWSRQRLMLALPGRSRGKMVRVIVTGSKQRGDLLIQRVAGCGAEEDISVLHVDDVTTVRSPGFDVAQLNRSVDATLVEHASCEHGAMLDVAHARCVCPPGFTGNDCAQACGANRYGDDCGGICSMSRRGCRSMVLCRPQLGCRCAPGFKGMTCDTECAAGEYGAGCRQRCGRCAGEPCDIYTGVCHQDCKDGRFPPFCQRFYKYLREAPLVKLLGYDGAVISADVTNTLGHGHPVSYQLQVQEEGATDWTSQTPQRLVATPSTAGATSNTEVGHVSNLKSGVRYQARVLLIDVTGRRYKGEQVPVAGFVTNCIVPDSVDYQLTSTYQWDSGFNITWSYPTDNIAWCPLLHFEVRLLAGWRRILSRTPAGEPTMTSFSDLLPGTAYQVEVAAVSERGAAASSQLLTVRTGEEAPDHVIDLHMTKGLGRSQQVTWQPPRRPAGVMKRYQLSYQCLHLLACPEQSCAGSQGHLETMATSSIIAGLLPHAVYKISVAGVSGSVGPTTALLTATDSQLPDVAPAASARPLVSRSNSSLTVQWQPPSASNCSALNGYLLGYRYELSRPPQLAPLLEATTTNTTATFTRLEPHTLYLVKVYVVTEDGWSGAHALNIVAKTRATTPGEVRDLVVYSRGRRRLGLRWKEPRLIYGDLESFTVTIAEDDVTLKSSTVSPQRCAAWPLLYCHVITELQADGNYSITVQARNAEVAEDGDETVIVAQTKEAAPDAPTDLRVVNLTAESATIEWGIPDMINGKLRSFVINIEETDSVNSSDCCQHFPLREMPVSSEQANYQIQLTGLRPASSYEVSVSAKTVALGSPVTLTLHTRPGTPVLTVPPRLLQPANQKSRLQVHVTAYKQDQMVSRYLLYIEGLSADKGSRDEKADEWLAQQVNASTNQSLTLVAEFTQATLSASNQVNVALPLDGSTRQRSAKDTHRLLLALVLDYCGSVGVGFIWSEPVVLFKMATDEYVDSSSEELVYSLQTP